MGFRDKAKRTKASGYHMAAGLDAWSGGDLVAAEAEFRASLASIEEYGLGHPPVRPAYFKLAAILIAQGSYEEGRSVLTQALISVSQLGKLTTYFSPVEVYQKPDATESLRITSLRLAAQALASATDGHLDPKPTLVALAEADLAGSRGLEARLLELIAERLPGSTPRSAGAVTPTPNHSLDPDHLRHTSALGEDLQSIASGMADRFVDEANIEPTQIVATRPMAATEVMSFLFCAVSQLVPESYSETQRNRFLEEIITAAYTPFFHRIMPAASPQELDNAILEWIADGRGQLAYYRSLDGAELAREAASNVLTDGLKVDPGIAGPGMIATITNALMEARSGLEPRRIEGAVQELEPLVADGDDLGPAGGQIRTFIALAQSFRRSDWDHIELARIDVVLNTDYTTEEREAVSIEEVQKLLEHFDRGDAFTPEEAFRAMAQQACGHNRVQDAIEAARKAMPAVTRKLIPRFTNLLGEADDADRSLALCAAWGLAAQAYLTSVQADTLYAGFAEIAPVRGLGIPV